MNYADRIFDMLKVKPNEEFYLKFLGGLKWKISENLVLKCYNDIEKTWSESIGTNLCNILNGTYEIEKVPKLSNTDMKAVPFYIEIGTPWVAKDANGYMFAYEIKPVKKESFWYSACEQLEVSNKCFKFISWKDEEPTNLLTELMEFQRSKVDTCDK